MKKKISLLTIVCLLLCVLCGCSETLSFVSFNDSIKEFDTSVFYGNVETMRGADPSLIYVAEKEGDPDSGYYYAYVTGTSTINAWRTKDMTNWQYLGAAFRPDLDTFWGYLNFWAPSVFFDETDNCYYMYFSASWTKKGTKTHYISLAKSNSPVGGFKAVYNQDSRGIIIDAPIIDFANVPKDNPLFEYRTSADDYENGYFGAIDAEPFVDPVDGQKYLVFTHDRSGGYNASSTYVMKMDDWQHPDYSTITCITECGKITVGGSETVFEGTVNEGPYMIYHEGLYYLTFSINSYDSPDYQVRQAVGHSPMGPFKKVSVEDGGVVITTDNINIYTNSSGHHSFIWVGDQLYLAYHTFLNDTDISESRKIRFDKVSFVTNDKGLPIIYANGPTVTLQPLPDKISGLHDYAGEAKITADNLADDGDVYWLNDGTLMMHENSVVKETRFKEGKSVITLTWDDYIAAKCLMIYNSRDYYSTFTCVDNVRLFYEKDAKTGVAETGRLDFNYDNFAAVDYKCAFAGASVSIEFNELKINKLEITISSSKGGNGFAVPEIAVLGRRA